MGRGGLILEGIHTNKKIGARFFYYGLSRILFYFFDTNERNFHCKERHKCKCMLDPCTFPVTVHHLAKT
jgi:hypothetical protein